MKSYIIIGGVGIIQSLMFVALAPAHFAWVGMVTFPLYAWMFATEIGGLWKRS